MIAARAKKEKALNFFAKASGMHSNHHAGTTQAPAGRSPMVRATGGRLSINMLSAFSALCHFRFMLTGRYWRQINMSNRGIAAVRDRCHIDSLKHSIRLSTSVEVPRPRGSRLLDAQSPRLGHRPARTRKG